MRRDINSWQKSFFFFFLSFWFFIQKHRSLLISFYVIFFKNVFHAEGIVTESPRREQEFVCPLFDRLETTAFLPHSVRGECDWSHCRATQVSALLSAHQADEEIWLFCSRIGVRWMIYKIKKRKSNSPEQSVRPHLSVKALIVFKRFLCKNDELQSRESFKGSVLVEKIYI